MIAGLPQCHGGICTNNVQKTSEWPIFSAVEVGMSWFLTHMGLVSPQLVHIDSLSERL